TASPLVVGTAGIGNLTTATDIDYWVFPVTAGQIIQVEVQGTRREHSAWDFGNNVPKVTLFGPDGTSYLTGHDFAAWAMGKHDLDIPAYRVASTGNHYVRIAQQNPATNGGFYTVKVSLLALGSLQNEIEPNDTYLTATAITPGTVYGSHV